MPQFRLVMGWVGLPYEDKYLTQEVLILERNATLLFWHQLPPCRWQTLMHMLLIKSCHFSSCLLYVWQVMTLRSYLQLASWKNNWSRSGTNLERLSCFSLDNPCSMLWAAPLKGKDRGTALWIWNHVVSSFLWHICLVLISSCQHVNALALTLHASSAFVYLCT